MYRVYYWVGDKYYDEYICNLYDIEEDAKNIWFEGCRYDDINEFFDYLDDIESTNGYLSYIPTHIDGIMVGMYGEIPNRCLYNYIRGLPIRIIKDYILYDPQTYISLILSESEVVDIFCEYVHKNIGD